MKKSKILFRTSGGRAPGKQLGMGHIFRCINLANNFDDLEIYFLIEDYGNVSKIILEKGFRNYIKLKKNISLDEDILKTQKIIEKEKIDLIIVDKFDCKQKFVREIKKKSKILVMSDLQKYDYSADLVVNGFIGFNNKITTNKFGSKCLLGPKFQILEKNFGEPKIVKNKKFDLLITLGGFDEQNIIESILELLVKIDSKLKIKIILGPATIKSRKVYQLEKKLKTVKIIQKTNNMKKEIASSKFGICAGGITSYEFASMKIPFGIISQVKHQTKTAKIWEKKNVAINLGRYNQKSIHKIERFIEKISIKKDWKNSMVVDGKGVHRVKNEILKLI